MEAVSWVEEHSCARGATRVMLRYMAEQAEGCIVVVPVMRLATVAKISRSTVFRSFNKLERSGEIVKIDGVSLQSVNCFHLAGWCRTFFRLGSDHATRTCRQVAAFRARYGGCRILPYIRGRQMQLPMEAVGNWVPVITDAELRWRSDRLKEFCGIKVEREAPFRLKAC